MNLCYQHVQENESIQDYKGPDDEPMISDINDENKTKSTDNRGQNLEKFYETDEKLNIWRTQGTRSF
ncbi:hypothetical protein R6Q57_010854 [Mikania cordata]